VIRCCVVLQEEPAASIAINQDELIQVLCHPAEALQLHDISIEYYDQALQENLPLPLFVMAHAVFSTPPYRALIYPNRIFRKARSQCQTSALPGECVCAQPGGRSRIGFTRFKTRLSEVEKQGKAG
jgi:hypothetical protein